MVCHVSQSRSKNVPVCTPQSASLFRDVTISQLAISRGKVLITILETNSDRMPVTRRLN